MATTSPISSRQNPLQSAFPLSRSEGPKPVSPAARESVSASKARGVDVFTAAPATGSREAAKLAAFKSASLQSLFGGAVKEQDVLSQASGAGAVSYTIQPGDTLSGIADRFGTTVDALQRANGISNPDRIFAGQTISVPTADSAPASGGGSYTVQAGDTLSGIADRFGTTVDAIAQANGISNPNFIQVGQVLTLPGANGPGNVPPPPPSQGTAYTVQPGDTLSGIAGRFGTTVDAIAQANGISNPNFIQVGQVLTIPGAGGVTPVPGPVGGGASDISLEQLRAIMPNLPESKARQYLPYLNQAMAEAQINTPARKAAFLAQLAHESVQFQFMEEIADGSEYEGRLDLGNTQPGDGMRYKGRGPIQLTGRANYISAGNALGIDLVDNPTRAADPDVGFRVAAWYWTTHNCNAMADAGNFVGITRAINGGLNGEASREAYWNTAKQVLATAPTPPPSGDGFRSNVLNAAQSQVGNWNMNRYLNGDGPEAWCNDFVSWCYQQAGKPLGPDGWYRYVPYMQNWLQQSGQWMGKNGTPSPGDIVTFDWDHDGVPDHTGIVKSVNADGSVNTIEGNVNGSNDWNGQLAELRRTRADIVGFGHLN